MLLALVFRGGAFEFRWRDPAHRRAWDIAFTGGSFVATLCQGIVLGALLQGVDVANRAHAGGWWDWLTPFSLVIGVSVVVAYALLGSMVRLAQHPAGGPGADCAITFRTARPASPPPPVPLSPHHGHG